MAKILVDGAEVDVPPEFTLLQACEAAGAEIPRFCYHERLSIAGNCRMCLIEVKVGGKSGPKPVASCAQQVKDLPPPRDNLLNELITTGPTVTKAREGVMEFLLINHPLDCPICDQGGECDLQDQSMAYGRGGKRFDENKRAVEEKFMGPLVKTVMTRCIQCTRCIRFVTEVAGVSEIGATGRGEDMEVTTYLEASLTSELSANVIDLCPVGALTSKPYAFNARPWELRKTETIDVMDALGSNIRVDARGDAVLRVLPRVNEEINEEWISDKTRYAEDGLARQRLDRPYIRENGKLRPASWDEALGAAANALLKGGDRIGAIAGDLACAESMKATLDLFAALGSKNLDCRPDGAKIGGGPRSGYIFNATIAGIDEADVILLVGTNPRLEAPVLNARIRKAWLRGAQIGVIGEAADLSYRYTHVGASGQALSKLGDFADVLKGAAKPLVIVGQGALARDDGAAILRSVAKLGYGVNVLHTAAGRVGGLDLGFLPGAGGKDAAAMLKGGLETLLLLGVDEVELPKAGTAIYIGTHGDRGAHRADIILPGAAYTEKDATWVNTEGRVQYGRRATAPKGDAKEDWTILRALSAVMGKTLPYDSLQQLRAKMIADHPTFGRVDYAPGPGEGVDGIGADGALSDAPLKSPITDFYLTNPIARASKTMAECSRQKAESQSTKVAAE
ncbi:NADH-quinone oxidoreductase subunit NuoG [Terricaulis sp.]|uniref:NADH-quinone oxidoreductase subunit NuoG n=1 Tax=Terricaulis sp. TaxID=2768686 RepID=UPI0037836293